MNIWLKRENMIIEGKFLGSPEMNDIVEVQLNDGSIMTGFITFSDEGTISFVNRVKYEHWFVLGIFPEYP